MQLNSVFQNKFLPKRKHKVFCDIFLFQTRLHFVDNKILNFSINEQTVICKTCYICYPETLKLTIRKNHPNQIICYHCNDFCFHNVVCIFYLIFLFSHQTFPTPSSFDNPRTSLYFPCSIDNIF